MNSLKDDFKCPLARTERTWLRRSLIPVLIPIYIVIWAVTGSYKLVTENWGRWYDYLVMCWEGE